MIPEVTPFEWSVGFTKVQGARGLIRILQRRQRLANVMLPLTDVCTNSKDYLLDFKVKKAVQNGIRMGISCYED